MSPSVDEENHGVVRDRDILGEKANVSHEEATAIVQLTPDEQVISKKVRKKVDLLILPVAFIVYVMNYIDRNNYASARLQGLEEDLNLTDTQYQTGNVNPRLPDGNTMSNNLKASPSSSSATSSASSPVT